MVTAKPSSVGLVTCTSAPAGRRPWSPWSPGWARTYILALVSSASVRTSEPDLGLAAATVLSTSGKRSRRPDARIGSETDHQSSVPAPPRFATDVLMIALTRSIILFSIHPWLALVTPSPLPLIAWMIHLVAGSPAHRLREGGPHLAGGDQRAADDVIPGIRVVKALPRKSVRRSSARPPSQPGAERPHQQDLVPVPAPP